MTDETAHLIRELTGRLCVCGDHKQSGHTFCGPCYRSLPKEQTFALYRHIGHGYEEAYATCKDTLFRNGRIRPLEKKAAASQGSMFDVSPYPN